MGDDAFKLICWINDDVIKHDHDNCLVEASNLIMINAIIISIPHMLRSLYFFDEKTPRLDCSSQQSSLDPEVLWTEHETIIDKQITNGISSALPTHYPGFVDSLNFLHAPRTPSSPTESQ